MNATLFTSSCAVLALAAAGPSFAQTTTRISVDSGAVQGDLDSYSPSISADGRFVAFYSEATNLVPGDTNDADDVFVRDRRTDTTTRVSVDSAGAEGNGDCYSPAISANGRFVAYYSEATNLVPGDTNAADDVFVYDRLAGITTLVSVDSSSVQGNDKSIYPTLSADGRFVAFHSWASNLVSGDTNGVSDVFVHDRQSGTTTRVSITSSGGQAADRSSFGTISHDGTRVVFESWAPNLAAMDTNGSPDIFVHDLLTGTTTCASVDASGHPGDAGCSYSSISGDGRIVGFESWSSNLVTGDTNGLTDVFTHDLTTGRTSRISVGPGGAQGDSISLRASLSYDGRFVAFKSQASNLVANDANEVQDIFLRDRVLGTTTRMSVNSHHGEAMGWSSQPVISADGRTVGFYSFAANLVQGDTNGTPDVFVRSVN